MPKKGRRPLDPLKNIASSGFIGYVEEEENDTNASILQVQEVEIERILDSPYQTREQMSPPKFAQLVHSIKTIGFQGFIPVRQHPEQEGYYQIVAGGHSRRDAAKESGMTTLPIVVVDFDGRQTGLGTALENLGREDLNVIEKGRLFLMLRHDLHLSQEQLAQELGEDMSRNQIKECEAAATSAPDIQAMLVKREGGIRAAKYLRQLDKLDEEEPGLAAKERAPIIEAFLNDTLTTDGVHGAVQDVLQKLSDAHALTAETHVLNPRQGSSTEQHCQNGHVSKETPDVTHHVIERTEKITLLAKRFQQYKRLIGKEIPTQNEREALGSLLQEIQRLLERQ
ncbi:MAG: ParB/RepB/Spo0J family partition protein [Ktedonobacteraceae bacterium]